MGVMSPEKIISRHPLQNGLFLELWDRSRPVAGDRWWVACEARITIPVHAAALPPDLQARAAAIVAALGREIVFSQKDERNFISQSVVPDLLKEMSQKFLNLAAAYFGRPDFPGKLIRKKFLAFKQQRQEQR
jgi:hypothetical protein